MGTIFSGICRETNCTDDEATSDLLSEHSEPSEPRENEIVVEINELRGNQTPDLLNKLLQLKFIPAKHVENSEDFCKKPAACLVHRDSVDTLIKLQENLSYQPMVFRTTTVGLYVLIFLCRPSTAGLCTAVFRLTKRKEASGITDVTYLDGGKPVEWSATVKLDTDRLGDGCNNWLARDVIMEGGHFDPIIRKSEAQLEDVDGETVHAIMRTAWWSNDDANDEQKLYLCLLSRGDGRYWSDNNKPKPNAQYTFPIVTKIRGVFLTTELTHVTFTVMECPLTTGTPWTPVMFRLSDGTQTAKSRRLKA